MTIRPAKPADMMELLDLMVAAHTRSVYAGVDEIDRDYTRNLFVRAMHFNGHTNANATLFLISEREGKIEGYFFGLLDRVYQIGKKLAATDVHFYLSPEADPRDAIRIIDAYLEWTEANPKVVEVRIGESNAFGEPDPRFAALLERKGFTKAATVFTKRTGT